MKENYLEGSTSARIAEHNPIRITIEIFKNSTGKGLNIRYANLCGTVDPVYSERGYSEYPIIVNGFLRTDR